MKKKKFSITRHYEDKKLLGEENNGAFIFEKMEIPSLWIQGSATTEMDQLWFDIESSFFGPDEVDTDDNKKGTNSGSKVLTWMKDLSLETYIKQIQTWKEVNEDVSTNTKYQDFVESLKINMKIKGLPQLVADYVLLE